MARDERMDYLLYCPQCGKSMVVAPRHTRATIGCPHCRHPFRPAAITPLGSPNHLTSRSAGSPSPIHPPSPSAWHGEAKSRVVAGLLGVFLGAFGLHRFYLGYNGVGAIQLTLTLAGLLLAAPWCGPFICCTPFVAVWGFTEGIFCLLGWMGDADGRPLGP